MFALGGRFEEDVVRLVTAQRLGELVLARRNTHRLLAQGAHEVGAAHYPLIVALHAAWLVGLWYIAVYRAPAKQDIDLLWLAVFIILQLARESKAGRLGTFVLLVGLGFGMLGFAAKGLIKYFLAGIVE